MASSLTIKANIDSVLVKNGNKNISGPILHDIVKSILDVDIRATGKITDHINSPSQGTISADFFVRKFYDSSGKLSVDYGNRKLYRVDGTYFDWNGGVGSGTVTSVGVSSTDFSVTSAANPIVSAGSFLININNGAVTYSKIQNVSAQSILGNYKGTSGIVREITIGSGLSLDTSTGVLSATSTLASQTSISLQGIDATTIATTAIGTTKSGHGNFVVTRVVWVTKTATLTGGPLPSEAQFSISWSGGGITPIGGPSVLVSSSVANRSCWADLLQNQLSISPSTVVSINITTAATGYTSHTMDLYLIGFYEIP